MKQTNICRLSGDINKAITKHPASPQTLRYTYLVKGSLQSMKCYQRSFSLLVIAHVATLILHFWCCQAVILCSFTL